MCGPALEVFVQDGLGLGIVLDLAADLFRPLPFSAVEDQAQQAPGRDVGGVDERGERQVLEPLGVESMGLAPEGELHLGVGIAPGLGPGRLVGGEVGLRDGLGRADGREESGGYQQGREHLRFLLIAKR